VVFVDVVKDLLNHVISPQVSGNESAAYRRAIAYAMMEGFLSAAASGAAKKYAKVLPRDIHALLEDVGRQSPCAELAKSVAAQVRQRLASELDRETAEKVARVFEEVFTQIASSTPADLLPAEEKVKFYRIGRDMGVVALALDSVPGPSPSRI
jgi:predicted transglutaminase-like cysteine proteinase